MFKPLVSEPTLYPTQNLEVNVDDKTVVTSNTTKQIKVCAPCTQPMKPAIPRTHAVADTRATSVFVLKGTPMRNIWPTTNPLTISLPDGKVVKLTHVCNFELPGLPTILEGHIVPDLSMALLVGICILCKAGCIVIFTKTASYVMYGGNVILTGYKDPSTDLWVFPITPDKILWQGQLRTSPGSDSVKQATELTQPQAGPCRVHALQPTLPIANTPTWGVLATSMHSVQTRANAVTFTHQPLCNPKISFLIESLRKGFLQGCPNLNKELVAKYFNPNPATAKGYLKQPKKGIRSTRKAATKKGDIINKVPIPVPQIAPPILPVFVEPLPYHGPA